jgi:hypothetical protein
MDFNLNILQKRNYEAEQRAQQKLLKQCLPFHGTKKIVSTQKQQKHKSPNRENLLKQKLRRGH